MTKGFVVGFVTALVLLMVGGYVFITTGGLYGTIVALDGDAVQLRIADQVKVKVARSAVAGIQTEVKEA